MHRILLVLQICSGTFCLTNKENYGHPSSIDDGRLQLKQNHEQLYELENELGIAIEMMPEFLSQIGESNKLDKLILNEENPHHEISSALLSYNKSFNFSIMSSKYDKNGLQRMYHGYNGMIR